MTHVSRILGMLVAALLAAANAVAQDVVTYFHSDATSSPIAATDANGNLLWREDYEPYGARLRQENSPRANRMWFTGHHQDDDSGLVYAGARHYDPVTGRFMSVDPVGVDPSNQFSFSRYAYANNNPYRFVDPDGNDAVVITFPNYRISVAGQRISNLGHAGILLINPNNGATKYYEFGRYNGTDGVVRNKRVSDVEMKGGKPTQQSLNRVLAEISERAGQGGPIRGAYFAGANFEEMQKYAAGLVNKSSDEGGYGSWGPYCSCNTFVQDTLEKGGIDTPMLIDPRPNSYIEELRGVLGATAVEYSSAKKKDNGKGLLNRARDAIGR